MRPFLEKIPSNQSRALKVKRLNVDSFDYPLHFHPEYELTHIISGSGKRFIGDNITQFGPGDTVLVGKNLPHCWLDYGKSKSKAEAIVIQFDEESFGSSFFEVPELGNIKSLLISSARGMDFKLIDSEIENLLMTIPQLRGGFLISSFITLLELLAHCQNRYSITKSILSLDGHHSRYDRINTIINHLYGHFKEDVKLDELAAMVNMNVSAFCHYFKKCTNKTFTQYLNEIRIGYACKLLMETDANISEICFTSGYRNLSQFNRRFLELNKMTPSEYRKEVSMS